MIGDSYDGWLTREDDAERDTVAVSAADERDHQARRAIAGLEVLYQTAILADTWDEHSRRTFGLTSLEDAELDRLTEGWWLAQTHETQVELLRYWADLNWDKRGGTR